MEKLLKAISDPLRMQIIEILKDGRKCASDIADQLPVTSATVSHHLSVLKDAGLISAVKEKNFIYYELSVSVFEEIVIWINSLKGGNENEEN